MRFPMVMLCLREKFMRDYDHRLDGRRIRATRKRIEIAETLAKPCPMCGDVWAEGDRVHECANWAFRRWEAWLEEDWQVRKQTEPRQWQRPAPETEPQAVAVTVAATMTPAEEAAERAQIRALLKQDGYL
jgi:hypothetical protein